MEENDIGWCWWQLKKMGINNPLQISEPEGYDLFLNYCRGEAAKPDAATSQKILETLLENIKIEKNIYHKDVIDAMFRQVYSTATLPFKQNVISMKSVINAVDYDLGRNGFAYNDKDTASYMYTPGVHTQGNRGRTYRNDGVDIKNDENNKPYVFSIEDGEWLLYTITAEKAGVYALSFTTSGSGGIIDVYNNDQLIKENISIALKDNKNKLQTFTAGTIHLDKGINRIKIFFRKGGFDFYNFEIGTQ
jgi:hypothetical protein